MASKIKINTEAATRGMNALRVSTTQSRDMMNDLAKCIKAMTLKSPHKDILVEAMKNHEKSRNENLEEKNKSFKVMASIVEYKEQSNSAVLVNVRKAKKGRTNKHKPVSR